MVVLQYALTIDDYESYYCMINWDSALNKTKRNKQYAKVILLNTLLLLGAVLVGILKIYNRYSWLLIIGFAYTVYLQVKSSKDKIRRDANRFITKKENAYILKENKYTFNEVGITLQDSTEKKEYPWNEIIRLEENTTHYFFMLTEKTGIVLPKKNLSNSDANVISKLIAEKISLEAAVGHLIKE